jgi:Tfp pilus assembly protein PilO
MRALPARTPLLRRIASEHRRLLVPLLLALVANVLVYTFGVYPLQQRVANIEVRNRAAAETLAAAKRQHAAASGTLTAKDRASKELATFYTTVLPQDFTGARRLTTLRLQQLARQSGLDLEKLAATPVEDRNGTLTQLKIELDLIGDYDDIRSFLYQLEIAPEFVVIDNVVAQERENEGDDLAVRVDLSTYYRNSAS